MPDDLPMFTIYRHPSDHPESYVVRRFTIGPGVIVPDAEPLAVAPTLELAREALLRATRSALYPLPRSPDDDPCIVETWV